MQVEDIDLRLGQQEEREESPRSFFAVWEWPVTYLLHIEALQTRRQGLCDGGSFVVAGPVSRSRQDLGVKFEISLRCPCFSEQLFRHAGIHGRVPARRVDLRDAQSLQQVQDLGHGFGGGEAHADGGGAEDEGWSRHASVG